MTWFDAFEMIGPSCTSRPVTYLKRMGRATVKVAAPKETGKLRYKLLQQPYPNVVPYSMALQK